MKKVVLLLIFIVSGYSLAAAPDAPDFKAILAEIDAQQRFLENDLSFMITVVAKKPKEEDSVYQLQIFQRMKENKSVSIILKPEVYKGTGYLLVDNDFWIYDPESRKFSHSSFMENFQNTNAKNSDFRLGSLQEDYTVKQATPGKLGQYQVWIMDLQATSDRVPVAQQKFWVTQDSYLVLKKEEYSLSGKLVRTIYLPHYTKLGKHYLPDKILIVDNLKKGEETQMRMEGVSSMKLPDYYFTKAYLEEVNR